MISNNNEKKVFRCINNSLIEKIIQENIFN